MIFNAIILATAGVLTNFSAIATAPAADIIGARVDAVVRVVATCSNDRAADPAILVDDAYASMILLAFDPCCAHSAVEAGDIIRVKGIVFRTGPALSLCVSSIDRIGKTNVPLPIPVTADKILNGSCDNKLISLCGRVHDVARDDIDPKSYHLVLDCDGIHVYSYFRSLSNHTAACQSLINAKVCVKGICRYSLGSYRRLSGRLVNIPDISDIGILHKPDSAFDAPDLDCSTISNPSEISSLGRRRTSGQVLVAGKHTPALLRTSAGDLINVRFSSLDNLPQAGDFADVVGDVATDLFHFCLLNAHWRKSECQTPLGKTDEPSAKISSKDILADNSGRRRINASCHGKPISIIGTVISMPADKYSDAIVLINDGYSNVPVDVSPVPDLLKTLSVGCTVRVAGICSVNTELWHPFRNFPRIRGFSLTLRTPSDLTILSRPPWWTPLRLFFVIVSLVVVLSAFLIWIRILKKIIDRRSRQLLKEEIARAGADLRVTERTRLAAELHDSVSQNLTAIACHLSVIGKTMTTAPEKAKSLIRVADHLLQSSRTELRRCLYDLRSDLLELPEFSEAIRLTLQRISGDVDVTVRFNVPRAQLLDSTAHSILCIVRELTSNAIVHGQATKVKVAGKIDNGILFFSVKDNGCGFLPSSVKDISEGHLGLDGIRNRVKQLGGKFALESAVGHGTRAVVTIPVKRQ